MRIRDTFQAVCLRIESKVGGGRDGEHGSSLRYGDALDGD